MSNQDNPVHDLSSATLAADEAIERLKEVSIELDREGGWVTFAREDRRVTLPRAHIVNRSARLSSMVSSDSYDALSVAPIARVAIVLHLHPIAAEAAIIFSDAMWFHTDVIDEAYERIHGIIVKQAMGDETFARDLADLAEYLTIPF